MNYFNDHAAMAYLDITMQSYDFELIDKKTYLERLHDLQKYYQGEKSKQLIDNVNLMVFELEGDQKSYSAYKDELEAREKDPKEFIWLKPEEDFLPALRYETPQGRICNWFFDSAESKCFPSMPHGYKRDFEYLKFDPFSGYIFEHDTKIQKEDREYIINLWNDLFFRTFIRSTLYFYIKRFCVMPWDK